VACPAATAEAAAAWARAPACPAAMAEVSVQDVA